jgi:glycine/D-amino acid oxidase-like deaminating enzyme
LNSDVVVIGAGIIGLAIARELRRRGLQVIVYERGKAGMEASWAGAGMLAPHGESFPDQYWTGLAFQALELYEPWVRQLEAESGISIDYLACGTREFQDSGVVEFPREAVVDPRDVCRALLTGLDIREGVEIRALDAKSARAVIVACGAWSGLIPGLPPAIPVKGWLIAYDMPPGSLGSVLREGHTYILQRSNGLTIVGSTEQRIGFDRAYDAAAISDLERRGAALWPALAERRPVDAWCGFRPATPNGIPEVRRLPDTPFWLAYGHYRNGILLAPVTARLIADEVISSLETG